MRVGVRMSGYAWYPCRERCRCHEAGKAESDQPRARAFDDPLLRSDRASPRSTRHRRSSMFKSVNVLGLGAVVALLSAGSAPYIAQAQTVRTRVLISFGTNYGV